MAVYRVQDTSLTAVADAIRAKAGTSDALAFPDGFVEAVEGISAGGGVTAVSPKEVNFYDYDGTCVYAYSVEEAQALTELPAGPEHEGLVFQGWNWSLENINALTRAMNIGAMYTTDDGTTRLYITLQEGRTSPMLGMAPNGTVTVDWGDGSDPDTVIGLSTEASSGLQWKSHSYAAPGDYVIRLTVDGEVAFTGADATDAGAHILRYGTAADARNRAYQNALTRMEIGDGVTSIETYAFQHCYSLASITIPDGVTSIGDGAFQYCYSLASITIPDGVTNIPRFTFAYCRSLTSVTIPASVIDIAVGVFKECHALSSVTIPDGMGTAYGYLFERNYSLRSVTIPASVTKIGTYAFQYCQSLTSVNIPDGVTSTLGYVFYECRSLATVTIPASVTSLANQVFYNCYSMVYYDFTSHTTVPTLSATNAFTGIPADCEIRVPAALYDEWIAATNWSTYADYIVAVE